MLRGSCLCRRVSYEISGPLVQVGNCHCSMCRKAHGAAFATWGILGPQRLRWTSGGEHVAAYASSPGRQRLFCRNCGSPLASAHDGEIGEVVFASLDDDPAAAPAEHIFVGSKANWHRICDALPQHSGWPPGFGPKA